MTKATRRIGAVLALTILALCTTAAAYACDGRHDGDRNGAQRARVAFHKGHQGFKYTTTLTSPDSGTCGNDWANDTLKRTYMVRKAHDGYMLVAFDRGTFTTVAGKSPGACNTQTDNGSTVLAGITGRMGGFVAEKITGATFNPKATCAAVCDRNAFVGAFFGTGAKQTVTKFFYGYSSKDGRLVKHVWINQGNATSSHNRGDIATA